MELVCCSTASNLIVAVPYIPFSDMLTFFPSVFHSHSLVNLDLYAFQRNQQPSQTLCLYIWKLTENKKDCAHFFCRLHFALAFVRLRRRCRLQYSQPMWVCWNVVGKRALDIKSTSILQSLNYIHCTQFSCWIVAKKLIWDFDKEYFERSNNGLATV